VSFDGFDRIMARLEKARRAINEAPAKAGKDWLEQDFKPAAKALAPVATGELRDSIDGEVDATGVTVFAAAPHAPHVEHGTTKMAAQPFMQPALDQTKDKLKKRILDEVRKGMK
jgi:HK97 gp10 family phage protein